MTRTGQRGRRPGGPDTRGQILEAARDAFAARGFRATTIRSVAAAAGVDAALVHHYFGSKDDLFLASVSAPMDPRVVLAAVFEPGLAGAGHRLVSAVLQEWDKPESRQTMVALLRSSLADPQDRLVREGFVPLVLRGLREAQRGMSGPAAAEAELRSQLIASQLVGLLMARYVLELEPLASLPRERVATMVGPTVQRYLEEPLATSASADLADGPGSGAS